MTIGSLQRVVVAMSGGVDSSVAAALLREEGHQVIGVTLKLQECHESRGSRSCCGVDGIIRARATAGQLGIPHYVLDCVREFDQQVLRPAWEEYAIGRTPSPCLLCNERIKFGALLSWSRQLGASLLATGHYAKLETLSTGEHLLLRGANRGKDQSYFLAGLGKGQLSSVCFPVGHLDKQAVRELARSMGLSTAETRDSQDACLVGPDQSFAEMLRERFGGASRPGPIVDDDGRVLGGHRGVHHFTVGQRKGLPVSSTSRRWVKAVRAEDSAIVVTDNEDNLYSTHFVATGLNWLGEDPHGSSMECEVQVRYRHAAEAARIQAASDGAVSVAFERPVRAITPGQAAVFYDGARILGRGWIHARG
jgi:tRNA-uridine 2-sulfurtransferase